MSVPKQSPNLARRAAEWDHDSQRKTPRLGRDQVARLRPHGKGMVSGSVLLSPRPQPHARTHTPSAALWENPASKPKGRARRFGCCLLGAGVATGSHLSSSPLPLTGTVTLRLLLPFLAPILRPVAGLWLWRRSPGDWPSARAEERAAQCPPKTGWEAPLSGPGGMSPVELSGKWPGQGLWPPRPKCCVQ